MARLFVFLTAMAAAAAVSAQSMVRVVIDTEHGEIEVAIDQGHAPGTSANFLRYLDAGHYDGGQFHRTVTMQNQPNNDVKIEVIQASVNAAKREAGFDAIPLERTTTTGLEHKDGAISMARGAPDSATWRCCTARSKSLTSLCRLQSHPAQYVSGIPSAAILLSISHPIRCSTRCLANVRARISGPMIAL